LSRAGLLAACSERGGQRDRRSSGEHAHLHRVFSRGKKGWRRPDRTHRQPPIIADGLVQLFATTARERRLNHRPVTPTAMMRNVGWSMSWAATVPSWLVPIRPAVNATRHRDESEAFRRSARVARKRGHAACHGPRKYNAMRGEIDELHEDRERTRRSGKPRETEIGRQRLQHRVEAHPCDQGARRDCGARASRVANAFARAGRA